MSEQFAIMIVGLIIVVLNYALVGMTKDFIKSTIGKWPIWLAVLMLVPGMGYVGLAYIIFTAILCMGYELVVNAKEHWDDWKK
jgi:hypothetical protein